MLLKSFLALEGGAVDALEHGPLLVATPIGSGHAEQLEGVNLVGGGDVGPLAQVGEGAVAVGGQLLFGGYAFYDLQLVGLVGKHAGSVLTAKLPPHEGVRPCHRLAHQCFDALQVLGSEGARYIKVVIEPILGGRADTHAGFGKELEHRVGHHMGSRMAHAITKVAELLLIGFRGLTSPC